MLCDVTRHTLNTRHTSYTNYLLLILLFNYYNKHDSLSRCKPQRAQTVCFTLKQVSTNDILIKNTHKHTYIHTYIYKHLPIITLKFLIAAEFTTVKPVSLSLSDVFYRQKKLHRYNFFLIL